MVPRRVDDFRGLTQPNRMRLLRSLQREPDRTAQSLATEFDLPVNTVRDHLKVLEDEGFVTRRSVHTGTRGRPPTVFRPVDGTGASIAADRRVADARRRGELLRRITKLPSTGLDDRATAQLDVLYEHLDDAGLEPTIDEETLAIDLTPCAYHALIDEDQQTVCAVHARLVGDVLGQVDGPLAMRQLLPFTGPHTCRLLLTTRPDPGSLRG